MEVQACWDPPPILAWVAGGRGLPSGAFLDCQMSLRWGTPQPGEELPRLFQHLRMKPPGGHLIPENSGQAPDPQDPTAPKGSAFSETRLQWGGMPGWQRDHGRDPPTASFSQASWPPSEGPCQGGPAWRVTPGASQLLSVLCCWSRGPEEPAGRLLKQICLLPQITFESSLAIPQTTP